MATATVASSSTASSTGSSPITITKPTGLSIDDLMVFVGSSAIGTAACSISTASGWTLAESADVAGAHVSIQYKVADAGDVAASDFSWTFSTGSSQECVGAILRVTDFFPSPNIVEGNFDYTTVSAADDTVIAATGTASIGIENCLVVVGIAAADSQNASGATVSNYTSTPTLTWTEIYDDNGGAQTAAAAAYASNSGQTDVTAVNADLAIGQLDNQAVAVVVIRAYYPTSGTTALLSVSPEFQDVTSEVGTSGTATLHSPDVTVNDASGSAENPTMWTTSDKT